VVHLLEKVFLLVFCQHCAFSALLCFLLVVDEGTHLLGNV